MYDFDGGSLMAVWSTDSDYSSYRVHTSFLRLHIVCCMWGVFVRLYDRPILCQEINDSATFCLLGLHFAIHNQPKRKVEHENLV